MKQADGHGVEAMPGLRPVKGRKYYKPKFGFGCKAKRIGGGTLVECMEEDGYKCPFSVSYGHSYYCKRSIRPYH
jgi:hypothetical protein